MINKCFLFVIVAVFAFFGLLRTPESQAEMISLFDYQDLKVDTENKIVQFPVQVVNTNTTTELEFVLSTGQEKDYESIFVTTAIGSHVHAALTLISVEPGNYMGEMFPPKELFDLNMEKGSMVKISLAWDDKPFRPLREFVKWKSGNAMLGDHWYFSGSFWGKTDKSEVYVADATLKVIATFPTPDMVMGPAFHTENPYRALTEEFIVPNGSTLPPGNTMCLMRIQPFSKEAKK